MYCARYNDHVDHSIVGTCNACLSSLVYISAARPLSIHTSMYTLLFLLPHPHPHCYLAQQLLRRVADDVRHRVVAATHASRARKRQCFTTLPCSSPVASHRVLISEAVQD